MLPSYRSTLRGKSRRIAFAKELFPEPDSPTTTKVRPRAWENVTPSTACTVPTRVLKYSFRFSTRRKPLAIPFCIVSQAPQPRVEDAVQREAQQSKAHAGEDKQQRRRQDPVIVAVVQRTLRLGLGQHLAPGRQQRVAKSEDRDRSLEEHKGRHEVD